MKMINFRQVKVDLYSILSQQSAKLSLLYLKLKIPTGEWHKDKPGIEEEKHNPVSSEWKNLIIVIC